MIRQRFTIFFSRPSSDSTILTLTMSSTVYLVVGASRGIGQELVNQLSAKSDTKVIATVRKSVDFGKKNIETLILDQTDTASVKAAAAKVKEIDVLILNAAIGENEKLLSTSEERLQQYLSTNVLGVHRVVEAFLPALRARKTRKIIIISSLSGSMKCQVGAEFGFSGPYAVTKAANNMQAIQYHNELHKDGFIVVPIHPGWVGSNSTDHRSMHDS